MSHTITRDIAVPFHFCEGCRLISEESTDFYTDGRLAWTSAKCSHYEICRNAIELFVRAMPTEADVDGHPCRYYLRVQKL